ncbi:hypothetical protein U1Q18_028581, partial [Sarracenia purpurea var. burkii]
RGTGDGMEHRRPIGNDDVVVWRGQIGRSSRSVSRRGSSGSPEMVDRDCAIEGDGGFSGGSFEGEWCLVPWVGVDGGSPEEGVGGVCRHQSRGRC